MLIYSYDVGYRIPFFHIRPRFKYVNLPGRDRLSMALIFCFLMQIWMVWDLKSSLKILYNKQVIVNEWNCLSKLKYKTTYQFLHRCYLILYGNSIDVKRNVNSFTIFTKPIDIPLRSANVLMGRRYTYLIHFVTLLESLYRSKWLTIAGNRCSILSHAMLNTVTRR